MAGKSYREKDVVETLRLKISVLETSMASVNYRLDKMDEKLKAMESEHEGKCM